MEHLNCDVWADVDFGHGKVEIRCTKIGQHEMHACNVLMPDPHRIQHEEPTKRNIFEGDAGG